KKHPRENYPLSLYIPPSGAWSLAINTDPGIELAKLWPAAPPDVAKAIYPRLDGYQKNIADKEVARVPMKSGAVATAVELFTITLDPQGVLTMLWGDRSWSVDVKPARCAANHKDSKTKINTTIIWLPSYACVIICSPEPIIPAR